MTRRDYTILDLHLALDGELPPEDRAEFETWLASNPEMLAMSRRFATDRERLQTSLAPIVGEPVPERLARLLTDVEQIGLSGTVARLGSWRAAAAASLIVAAAAIGYYAGTAGVSLPTGGDENAIVGRALQAHVMYAAEKLHVVEVGADQKDHLLGWLSRRVGTTVGAPDLSKEGFTLVGGRLLPAAGKPAAQLMYQDHAGTRISLYITPDPERAESGFRLYEEGEARALYRLDNGYCYAVAGGLPEKQLEGIANAAYRQLLRA